MKHTIQVVPKEAFEEIKSHVKRLAFEITQYTSMNDFVIA